jgi:hypothetical protein
MQLTFYYMICILWFHIHNGRYFLIITGIIGYSDTKKHVNLDDSGLYLYNDFNIYPFGL